jgi:N-acetylmuramoyl-L-alanine amidase
MSMFDCRATDRWRAASGQLPDLPPGPSKISMPAARTARQALSLRIFIGLLSAALLITAASPVSAKSPLLFPEQTPRVALDPGHGGKDAGARGPTGLLEKSVCLALARNLALRLEAHYRVILTRSDDYQVELQQRTAIANQAEADLLISLHTAAGYVHATRGIVLYYYADIARNAPEDDMERLDLTGDPQQWSQTQKRHQPASLALATALKKRLDGIPDTPKCSIRGAPLAVLEGADMPAVLIEIGNITHPATEARLAALQDGGWLAAPIAEGIQDFLTARRESHNFNNRIRMPNPVGFRNKNRPRRPL